MALTSTFQIKFKN